MSNFIQDLRNNLDHLDYFKGGVKSQREHLNKLIADMNVIFRAAQQNEDEDGGATSLPHFLVYANENGTLVLYDVYGQPATV